MKLSLRFGTIEPPREMNWWQHITDFPTLVFFKNTKWEFVMYGPDITNKFDYICHFSEVKSYDANWYVTTYVDLTSTLIGDDWNKCECGAIYTSFPWDHMRFCRKWTKW